MTKRNGILMVKNTKISGDLMTLLGDVTAREMKVSMQCMMQPTLCSVVGSSVDRGSLSSGAGKFVESPSPVFLPGKTLKKIAIVEMRHAEAIAERVSNLGGEPTTQPEPFKIGETLKEILEIDKAEEEAAIKLYTQIIAIAGKEATKQLRVSLGESCRMKKSITKYSQIYFWKELKQLSRERVDV